MYMHLYTYSSLYHTSTCAWMCGVREVQRGMPKTGQWERGGSRHKCVPVVLLEKSEIELLRHGPVGAKGITQDDGRVGS